MAGSNDAPFTTIGGNDNTYPQGRKVTQWQINDNLDWTRGKHSYRFGVNTRRIDVSDYDLGEGTVPTAVYNDLAEFTYGAAYTESATFPISLKERIAAGNLDAYAMDTWKPTTRATFTAGLRATWNTDPVNQQRLFARPAGSFLDLSHSVSQPLDQAIETRVRALFPSTPLLVWQPRASVAYQVARDRRACRLRRLQRHYSRANCRPCGHQRALRAHVCGRHRRAGGRRGHCARRAEQRGRCALERQPAVPVGLQPGAAPCAGLAAGAPTCPLAVSLNTFPTGTLKTPYYYQYNFGVERQLGAHGAVRIDYVGTRGLHEPFQVGLNGYQTVCAGCFAPYPYQQPLDQRFGGVNEFRTDANSATPACRPASPAAPQFHLPRQLHAQPLPRRGFERRAAVVFHAGILSPLPGELSRQYGDCDYDVRQNISAFGIYPDSVLVQLRFCVRCFATGRSLRRRSFTPAFPSASSASRTRPMAMGFSSRRTPVCAPRSR